MVFPIVAPSDTPGTMISANFILHYVMKAEEDFMKL
jgi:hypothetical protein